MPMYLAASVHPDESNNWRIKWVVAAPPARLKTMLSCTLCARFQVRANPDVSTALRIRRPIGSGQYSTVKEALTNSDQVVAVKCIDLTHISKTLRFLRRELDIMKNAKHPSIVQYFGVYRDNKTIYISMEMCACSLKQKILMRGKLPEKEVIIIARDVISALEYLHKMHVAHRDIKPENILFNTEDRVKLVDFGLSRSLVMEKDITIVGTPYYLAPEVLGGTYSYECDMWSLGVVLYYALFGVVPFKAEDSSMLFHKISCARPTFPATTSRNCESFIQRLLVKNPRRRMTPHEAFEHPWLANAQTE